MKENFYNEYVVIDTEINAKGKDDEEIVQLAAIHYKDSNEINRFNELVNIDNELDSNTDYLLNLSQDELRESEGIEKVLPRFIKFIDKHPLVGHAIDNDIKIIEKEWCHKLENKKIDTQKLSNKICNNGGKRIGLTDLAEKLGVPQPECEHDALCDCVTTAAVYEKLKLIFNNGR